MEAENNASKVRGSPTSPQPLRPKGQRGVKENNTDTQKADHPRFRRRSAQRL